jgi:hypothetical protein
MPSCSASPVCVRNAALFVSVRAASNTGADSMCSCESISAITVGLSI